MNLKIELDQPFSGELKRNACDLVQEAIEHCRAEGRNRHEAVHEIRKNLKKMRALLRLIRLPIGEKLFKYENVWYRDTGRLISDIRDATSRLEILDQLENHYNQLVREPVFIEVRLQLQNYRRGVTLKVLTHQSILEKVRYNLKVGLQRIEDWNIPVESLTDLESSIGKVYKRGYRAYQAAKEDPTVENFHEWRKRIKYLMYHMRLLEAVWPKIVRAYEGELQKLSDLLGEDHDLAVLKQSMHDEIYTLDRKKERQIFTSLINRYSNVLRNQALPLGNMIYAEKPEVFRDRIASYLKSYSHTQLGNLPFPG